MLNPDFNSTENTVDLDQLASKKPAYQDPHCFPLNLYSKTCVSGRFTQVLLYMRKTGILQVDWIINWGGVKKTIISSLVWFNFNAFVHFNPDDQ